MIVDIIKKYMRVSPKKKNITLVNRNDGAYPFNEGTFKADDNNFIEYHVTMVDSVMIERMEALTKNDFTSLMDSLVEFSKQRDVELIYYYETLDKSLYDCFMEYGFEDKQVYYDANKYLHYYICEVSENEKAS